MTQKEMLADLQADLLLAKKAMLKALARNESQEYFDARERIGEIEIMIKMAK